MSQGQRHTECRIGGVRGEVSKGKLTLVSLESLRPTQMAVGMRSVKFKRRKLENRGCKRIEKILKSRPIPAVRGPGGDLYIIDHHHFGLALWQTDVEGAYACVVEDKSSCLPVSFWRDMEHEGKVYPYDENGRRIEPDCLPALLQELRHDPFRDLAWEVREAGGFRKSRLPYAEFRWANFFREHISLPMVRRNYDRAIETALKLSHSRAAADLPGFIGKSQ